MARNAARRLPAWLVVSCLGAVVACGGRSIEYIAAAGAGGTGAPDASGQVQSGASGGGPSAGGASAATGGSATGSAATGGSATGSAATGGSATGSAATSGNGALGLGIGGRGSSGASNAASTGGRGGAGANGGAGSDEGGVGGEPDVTCSEVPVSSVCIVGQPVADGDALNVGDPLRVEVQPTGCYAPNCTAFARAVCGVVESNGTYQADASFCSYPLTPPAGGCASDCRRVSTICASAAPLTAGSHWLVFQDQRVDFEVPSIVPHGSLCVETLERP